MPSFFDLVANSAVILATCFGMEGVAWGVHKYIMHSWGWGWHRSHHEHHDDILEKNDLFSVVFAVISIAFMVAASMGPAWLYWVGAGMMLYGILYFIVHDGLIHSRYHFPWLSKSRYAKRLIQAHRLHHAVDGPGGGVSFGFLYAPSVSKILFIIKKDNLPLRAAEAKPASPRLNVR